MEDEIFKWDGSDVTDIVMKSRITEAIYIEEDNEKIKIWMIEPEVDKRIYCHIRNCKNSLAAIIDEIKPLFGLPKLGTHRIIHKDKTYLLIKTSLTADGQLVLNNKLSQIKKTDDDFFQRQVQEIYTFRELLGITRSFDRSLRVRSKGRYRFPVSYYEPNMVPERNARVVPTTILMKWFGEEVTIDDLTREMLKVKKLEDITGCILKIRSSIDKVIERLDRDQISYSSFIISRIMNRLQSCYYD